MRILWINPIGTDAFDVDMAKILKEVRREGTIVDVLSFPSSRPIHLEYHAYEGLVIGDIVKSVYLFSDKYDGIVIGCFYDVGLREAREVSGRAIVTAPCQASLVFASHLGNTFSVLVGRRKWIPKMKENIETYGYGNRLISMRTLELGVHDFQADGAKTRDRLLEEGRKAVEEDGAEVLILGCTAEYGFSDTMQKVLNVPVIDAVLSPFKLVELLAETAVKFSWYPSRKWGGQSPPPEEVEAWGLFKEDQSIIGNFLHDEESQ